MVRGKRCVKRRGAVYRRGSELGRCLCFVLGAQSRASHTLPLSGLHPQPCVCGWNGTRCIDQASPELRLKGTSYHIWLPHSCDWLTFSSESLSLPSLPFPPRPNLVLVLHPRCPTLDTGRALELGSGS